MSIDNQVIDSLSGHPEIMLAILFRSVVAGRAKPDSDIDLAVAGSRALCDRELAHATGRAVDLMDLATATGSILGRILATGRIVRCSDPSLYAELIKRAIYDDADMAPYRDRILAALHGRWIACSRLSPNTWRRCSAGRAIAPTTPRPSGRRGRWDGRAGRWLPGR